MMEGKASWKPMVSPKPPENEKIVQAIRVMLDFGAYDIAIQFLQFIKEKKLKEKEADTQ